MKWLFWTICNFLIKEKIHFLAFVCFLSHSNMMFLSKVTIRNVERDSVKTWKLQEVCILLHIMYFWGRYLGLGGKTRSQTQTFSLAPTWWVSIPYWWNINSDGPVMWSEWKTLVFQNSSSLVNCTLGKGHVVLLRNASRILWKLLSNASMLIQRTGNCKLSSVTLGVQPLPTVHLTIRQSASFKQSQKDRKESQELRMPTQQQLLTPHPVLPA